jgi:hypothetical protein
MLRFVRITLGRSAIGERRIVSSASPYRSGRVAPPAADPSQATGRVKGRDNQLHRARVLEVRIHLPPAASQQTFGSSQDDARCSTIGRIGAVTGPSAIKTPLQPDPRPSPRAPE